MSSYRFCRTDDVGLLVAALNRCWAPHFPGEPPVTPASFKWSIRHLQVWCSSCMVAFSGADPIGVLIGAKRPSGTLIHRIAVHPDHVRQGHGRHMLTSLGSKLAILGPPRLYSEVPEGCAAAKALFSATGYDEQSVLTDYVSDAAHSPPAGTGADLVIPVTVDDLIANDLLGEGNPPACWERSVETLTARKEEIYGLAVASDERLDAYILYVKDGGEVLALRSLAEDGEARLALLLSHVRARGGEALRFPKVHPAEIPKELLATLGFSAAGAHRVYAATARSG